ncbi:GAF domain-containing protein, partial [Leptolyngbya sp. FACHB-36]|uniref:GAF domain-containing protein n=1 Tax=Leptolyngbya sp. FACHB-36 TaxID=2692808 RepID=UPI0016801BE5
MNLNGRILHVALDQETVLRRITYQICRLQELQDVLAETVREVRSFLGVDRVLIYKFHASGNGEVVAESIDENRLPSLLGLHFPADDIPEHARDLFVKARSRSIVDVATQQIGRSLLQELETEGLIFEEVRYRTVDPCHIEYLTA